MNDTNIRCIIKNDVPFKSFLKSIKPSFSGLKVVYENDGSNGLELYGYLNLNHNNKEYSLFFSELSTTQMKSLISVSGDKTIAFIASADDNILSIFNIFTDLYGGYIMDERLNASYIEYIPTTLALEL